METKSDERPDELRMEKAFVALMAALRELPTTAARFTVVNWAYEALDQRPQPLSATGGRRPAPSLPDSLFGVRHGGHLLKQRFTSEEAATQWATENYKGRADSFEIEQIAT